MEDTIDDKNIEPTTKKGKISLKLFFLICRLIGSGILLSKRSFHSASVTL